MAHAAVVLEPNEISLNKVKFRITGPVQSALSSIYPQKQVTGDITRDSQQHASVWSMSDWRGGIGLYRQRFTEDVLRRAWWAYGQLRHHEQFVLPALATATAASGVTGSFSVGAAGTLSSELYAAFGTTIKKYNNTTDSWGSSLHTLPAAATHALTFRMGNVVYLAFATTGGYTYTSDGAAFTDDTKDAKYLAYWDDRLWGIDNTGQLWFSTAIGVETNDAQLPLPDGSVTNLFVGPLANAEGETVLIAGTTYGPYTHDLDNAQFIPVDIGLAQHPDNCKGSEFWRDSNFYSSGQGIHRYSVSGGSPAISVMGPDRDDGLPSDKRGFIRAFVKTNNELLALMDATSAPGDISLLDSDDVLSAADVMAPDTGYSHILGWDGDGWEVKWLGGSAAEAITCAHVSYAYSTYRLWWGHAGAVYYMALPRDIINPNEITTFTYAASGELITPWFNADQVEVDKLALELRVEVTGASSTETVGVSYATDYSDTYTSLGTITKQGFLFGGTFPDTPRPLFDEPPNFSFAVARYDITTDGVTTYPFPDKVEPHGKVFRAIRFKVSMARGSTTTLTPKLNSLTLSYRKKLPAKYGYTVEVDLTGEYTGGSVRAQREALQRCVSAQEKCEFVYRDRATPVWVDVVQATGLEQTGMDNRGKSTLTLVQP